MVLTYVSYIQYGCGQQMVVVYSLNNVIMLSFHSSHAGPNYQNPGQICNCNSVRVHPYAYPQHMMVLKHVSNIQYGCGKQMVVVYSLNNVIMQSFHSSNLSWEFWRHVGDMSATCQNVDEFGNFCVHLNSPDTRFLCQKLHPTHHLPKM